MIRGTCGKCKKFLGFVPQTEQYQKLADREKKQESAPVLPRATENLLNARIELTKATEKFNKALDEYMIACKAYK
jgi:hypothetical protein